MDILQFALLALGLFYIIISIVSVIRFWKVFSSKSAIKISLGFYTGMFICSILRSISLYFISINLVPEQNLNDYKYAIFIYLLIIIPDMVTVCVYLFLAWYFYANFMLSHVNIAGDLNIFMNNGKLKFIQMYQQFQEKLISFYIQ
jgi:hypothetical protein